MSYFADNFEQHGKAGDGVANGWLSKGKPNALGPLGNGWKYDVGGHVVRPEQNNSFLYRAGLTGVTYDIRWVFAEFDFAEVIFRYNYAANGNNARMAVLVQNDVGRLVVRDNGGEIRLASWPRQPSSEFEIYIFVSGDVIRVYDSGVETADHHAVTANSSYNNVFDGIGLGNGRAASVEVGNHDAGFVSTTLEPSLVEGFSEASAFVTDSVKEGNALPQVERIAGLTMAPYEIIQGEALALGGGKPLVATLANPVAGEWRLLARSPGQMTVDVTSLRGAPTLLDPWGFDDPFGPSEFTFTLPSVSMFDRIGTGDLSWLTPDSEIDVVFEGALPGAYPDKGFAWEGLVASFDYSPDGLKVSCIGALRQLDLHLAKPGYPGRPIPYEVAIANQFQDRPDLRLRPMIIEWPSWWTKRFGYPPETPLYMRPTGVMDGDYWTGMVTRQTGAFEQSLSSYVQTLLGSMYTPRGRWALDLDRGRQPVLRHRDIVTAVRADTVHIDPVSPGVKISLTVDWSQSANVAYGQGVSLAGEGWSGQQVSLDGERTFYVPLAAAPEVHPANDSNPAWVRSRLRREVMLQLQQGLTLENAKEAARDHLSRFAEPGVTGTITLETDPKMDGAWLPRKTMKAGMNLWVPHLLGTGLHLHVTKAQIDRDNHTVTLTVDSKYRDQLTVDQVRLRGRDSLAITRQLIGGQYAPPIPDQLVPWNYAEGSGYIPSGSRFTAKRLFDGIRGEVPFPWTEITRVRKPSMPAWAESYMTIGPASPNADDNWAVLPNRPGMFKGYPVRAAQMASIRLLQIAAYDDDGYVMKVPFHVSFYASEGVNMMSMPVLSPSDALGTPYAAGQHYPFFDNAWEKYRADGTQTQTEANQAVSSAGLIRGYGTRQVPAGYWPASAGQGFLPTGMLADEGVFEIDTTRFDSEFNPFQPRQRNPKTGFIYVMVYCDQQGNRPVHFMGRMYRQEPGSTV